MVKNTRKGWLFAGGLAVGILAGALAMLSLRGGDGPYATTAPRTSSMGAAPASTAFVMAVAGNCEMTPILPSAGDGDGQQNLQSRPGAATPGEVAALILSGKEAAASGRKHDAEVEFLNACRNAAALHDGDPIPLADAMYQLGRLYANVGALGSPKAKDLYQRAERLYSASLEAYRARYGDQHEKTKFAQEGLITVQQATGGKAPTAIAKAPPAAAAAPVAAAPAPAPAPVAQAPAPAIVAAPAPAPGKPAATTEVARATPPAAKPAPEPAVHANAPVHEEAKPEAAPVRQARVAPPRRTEAARTPEPSLGSNDGPADDSAVVEPPRPRPQARRAPRREEPDAGEVAADNPPPRRERPVFVAPAESPAPFNSGNPGEAPQAEGSPNAQ